MKPRTKKEVRKHLSPLTATIIYMIYMNGVVFFGKDWMSFLSHKQIEEAILKHGSPISKSPKK